MRYDDYRVKEVARAVWKQKPAGETYSYTEVGVPMDVWANIEKILDFNYKTRKIAWEDIFERCEFEYVGSGIFECSVDALGQTFIISVDYCEVTHWEDDSNTVAIWSNKSDNPSTSIFTIDGKDRIRISKDNLHSSVVFSQINDIIQDDIVGVMDL